MWVRDLYTGVGGGLYTGVGGGAYTGVGGGAYSGVGGGAYTGVGGGAYTGVGGGLYSGVGGGLYTGVGGGLYSGPGGGLYTGVGGGLYRGPGGGLYKGSCANPYRSNWPPREILLKALIERGLHHQLQIMMNAGYFEGVQNQPGALAGGIRNLYTCSGVYAGFLMRGMIFDADANYLGWLEPDNSAWNAKGRYMGQFMDDGYILRNRNMMEPMARMARLQPMRPMRPMRPMTRMSRTIPYGWSDAMASAVGLS